MMDTQYTVHKTPWQTGILTKPAASSVPSMKILDRANVCFSEHEYFKTELANL